MTHQWRSQDFEVGAQLSSPLPSRPLPLKCGSGGVTPGNILGFYIAVGEFWSLLKREMGFLVKVSRYSSMRPRLVREYRKERNVSQNTA